MTKDTEATMVDDSTVIRISAEPCMEEPLGPAAGPAASPADTVQFHQGESGTCEPTFPQSCTVEATISEDAASSEGQVAQASLGGPEATATSQLKQNVWTVNERLRRKDGALASFRFKLSASSEATGIFQQMIDEGDYTCDPWARIPFPAGPEPYGTTGELFAKIKGAFKEQTRLADRDCALLTFWSISTWLHVALPLAPGVAITGCAHEGDAVLRTLRAFCYHPVLLVGLTSATLDTIRWQLNPTLLINEPTLSARMATLMGSSTGRGYLACIKADGCPTSPPPDYFGPKAVYLGEDLPPKSVLQNYIQISASRAPEVESQRAVPLSAETRQSFQNQLLGYRLHYLPEVVQSDFSVFGLTSELNAIATALGRCIVDAPDLRAELISLLRPYSEHQLAESRDSLGMLAVGAALSLCHQGKDQVLVGEIAAEVNRVLKDRGERLQYSPEKVGHRLKKAGLLSRRMGAAGNGFLMDNATQVLLHQVAVAYGCVGLAEDKENLHCPLCEQYK